MKYVCPCGFEYDPEVGDPDAGIAPGTVRLAIGLEDIEDLYEDLEQALAASQK